MGDVVVDTNVPMVANGRAGQASDACVEASIDRLLAVQANDFVWVDADGLILEEYSRHLAHRGQPGVGDAFFKWLWDNQAVEAHCRRVEITPTDEPRCFVESQTILGWRVSIPTTGSS